jgi:hypothetical protein
MRMMKKVMKIKKILKKTLIINGTLNIFFNKVFVRNFNF